jgi:hypothetical protein
MLAHILVEVLGYPKVWWVAGEPQSQAITNEVLILRRPVLEEQG